MGLEIYRSPVEFSAHLEKLIPLLDAAVIPVHVITPLSFFRHTLSGLAN
jgi:hypothetical protein